MSPAICSPSNGWRDDSPSDVRQVFGKLGWKDQRNDITFTTSYANNSLTGNGLQEQRFLERDYASVYTKPDITDNRGDVLQRHRPPQRAPTT